MSSYTVHANGITLGTFFATSGQEARDLCAQEAGYRDEADLSAALGYPSELEATQVE